MKQLLLLSTLVATDKIPISSLTRLAAYYYYSHFGFEIDTVSA